MGGSLTLRFPKVHAVPGRLKVGTLRANRQRGQAEKRVRVKNMRLTVAGRMLTRGVSLIRF